MTWLDVDGWLTPAEGHALRALSLGCDVLELGSYKGRSTVCVAQVARSVTSVDWHRGDEGCGHADTLAEFTANLEAHGVSDKVRVVLNRIEDVRFPPAFDLAFVDASHDAEGAEVSTRVALASVRPGGLVVWHDWDAEGVRAGVAACGLQPTGFRETLAWVRVPA